MRQKSETAVTSSERIVKDIRRATRKHHSAEEKIRIVLDGLRGEYSIAELCRREGIAESLYYSWSKEFLEAGKRRLAGDTVRTVTTDEVRAKNTQIIAASIAKARIAPTNTNRFYCISFSSLNADDTAASGFDRKDASLNVPLRGILRLSKEGEIRGQNWD
jgi:transposase